MMSILMWLFVAGIGPVLLGLAIFYGMMRSRRLTPSERRSRRHAVEAMYNDESDEHRL
ncbi:hypothetical protein [Rhizobium sp. L1K21]|uniref:hypothetical protein n=1 Tax=Rhizobium sp. L1K21 TaxID=2954933 RepID=UPI0020933C93|nr:hypothetical protein [Rhizobium sp. L1K21]MCO6187817.1 hypothetical protein [Rhizobium sp. L1K21]